MFGETDLKGLIAALGIGLMIGVVRERTHEPDFFAAGIRTHAIIALLGSVSWAMGLYPFIVTLLIVGAFVVVSYVRTSKKDPGLTGEVTIILTLFLSALAMKNLYQAAGLGVLCTILIQAKGAMHRWSREIISEQEISDALLILASLLIVNPLLPRSPIDPWGVLTPSTVWKIVVLLMAVGMAGHIARRIFGSRLGLPIAGFFSGFASSTAAMASFGERAKQNAQMTSASAAAALLANGGSLILYIGVITTVAPELVKAVMLPLVGAILFLGMVSLFLLLKHRSEEAGIDQSSGKSFKLSHALIIASMISLFSVLSAWLNDLFGSVGAIFSTTIVALAEVHASAASIGQLFTTGVIDLQTARWGIVAALGASVGAKIVLAWASGGKRYCILVSVGLVGMLIVAIALTII